MSVRPQLAPHKRLSAHGSGGSQFCSTQLLSLSSWSSVHTRLSQCPVRNAPAWRKTAHASGQTLYCGPQYCPSWAISCFHGSSRIILHVMHRQLGHPSTSTNAISPLFGPHPICFLLYAWRAPGTTPFVRNRLVL